MSLVDQALIEQGLERPQRRFHVGGIKGLVVVVEVHPARLAGDVVFPLFRIAQNGALAGIVECFDADSVGTLDFGLVDYTQEAFGLDLCGETVGIPAKTTFDAVAQHGLVATHHVLDVAGEQVPVVRGAVGKGRSVVKDELIRTFVTGCAIFHRLLKGVVGVPIREGLLLDCWEGRFWVDLLIPAVERETLRGAF